MPSQIVNAAAIRAVRYSIRAYASFFTGRAPIATGTVTTTPPYPVGVNGNFISLTYVTGAYTDVAFGMEVVFTDTATGAFKGRTHVRYGPTGSIVPGSIPVREFAQAKLNLVAGDSFAIYADWRLHDKLVAATSAFPPDQRFYTDEGSNPPPVACSGGHWAGKLDAGQTYATVLMTGSTSYTVDPDSGGSVTHLWTLPAGVTFAPGSANTDANPTLRVTVGEYLVYHAVTDSSNSKVTIQHVQLKAHDLVSSPPHRILYTPDTATADSGFGGTVRVLSGLTTQAAIPDGGLCIIWGVEYVNGQQVSYRNAAPGRAHILCVCIVRRDSQSGASDGSRTVTLELISPLERLKEITSYSKVMEESATPDAWAKIKTLGVKRAIIQLLQFYTTLIEAGFDLIFDSAFIDYRYPALYLQRSTFFAQVLELAAGIDARMVSDRTARLNLHTDPRNIPIGARAAITKTWHLLPADILTFDFPREHVDSVEQMKTSGFTGGASGNTPVFSVYPGASVGEGTDAPVKERLIVTDQDDLNARTGRYGAAADVIYQDADGLLYRAFPLTITLRGVYDFFDFSKEYVDFTTTLPDLARDVDLTKFLFCLASTSVGYDEFGSAITTCVFDVVTNAAPGETFTPPDESQAYYPPNDGTPQQPPLTLPPIVPGLRAGSGHWIMLNTDGNYYETTDGHTPFVQGGPTWLTIDAGLAGDGIHDYVQDPYTAGRFILATNIGLYTSDDPTGANTLTLRATLTAGEIYRTVEADFGAGYIYCVSYYGSLGGHAGTWYTYSTDNGVTWAAEAQITAHYHTVLSHVPPLHVSTHTAGMAVTAAFTSTGSAPTVAFFTLNGASVTQITTPSGFDPGELQGRAIHYPYSASPADSIAYFGHYGGSPISKTFRKIGGTITDISPLISGAKLAPIYNRSIHSAPTNPNRLVISAGSDDPGTPYTGIFVSRDNGASWTQISSGTLTDYFFVEVAGDNPDVIYLTGDNGAVGFVGDFATIDDRRGNLVTSGRNIRLYSP